MQLDSFEDVSNAPEPVFRILQRDSADDAMDVIAFLNQELSQIGTILAGYTRNQSFSRLHVLLLLQVTLRLESHERDKNTVFGVVLEKLSPDGRIQL